MGERLAIDVLACDIQSSGVSKILRKINEGDELYLFHGEKHNFFHY